MKKTISAILLSLFSIHYSCFIGLAQSNPLIESGKTKQKVGNHDGAIADFTGAIKQNELVVQKYLEQIEEYDKIPAFEKTQKGIEVPPVDVTVAVPYYLRGYSYSATGKNKEAMNDFNTSIKLNPKMGSAYYERGKLLWSTGKKEEACMDWGMAGSLKDSSASAMFDEKFCWKEATAIYKEASSKVRLNEFQEALNVIEKAVKLCPDSANYLGLRGRAYLGFGNYELAMQDFDKAISLSQKSIDAFFGRGVAWYSKGKWQEAFDDLTKAIQLNDRFADAHLYRAYACEGMGKNQSALFDYQQVQKFNPGSGLAYFKSGLLRSAMNDQTGACKDFNRAASMSYTEAQDYAEKCNTTKK